MNMFKKIFKREKKFPNTSEIFPKNKTLSEKILNQTKKIFKYFLIFFLSLFVIFWIFLYSFLWDFKNFFFNIPSMTWFFWEKNYLILMLNNSEIRPWWGFISSYAKVKFFLWIPTIEVKNSYDIWTPNPMIQPPYPYNKLLSEDKNTYKWRVFRDANLSPDFPTNVWNIISLYDKSNKKISNFDWVFSVDMQFLKSLLKISWEVEVQWKKFNENNFFYQTQILSKDFDLHSIKDLKNRKNFLKPLIQNIFSKIKKNPEKIQNLLTQIEILANQKHIQAFFSDWDLEKKIENFWWAWKFFPKWEDYISVNISNIWWRKANRYIRKNYFYDLDFSWENPVWTLKIISKHLWTKSLISDFYQWYYKIYLPKWVEILDSKTNFKDKMRITQELNSTVIWGLVHMQPWEENQILLKYKLPKIVNSQNYNLNLITQSWWNWENWNVSVREKTDNILKSNDFETKENVAFFEWKIFKDKLLNLKNLWDKTQPIIVRQKFVKNDLIEINFSEKISDDFLEDEKNFSIKDLNIKNKISDKIKISKKYIKWNNLYLKLKWISYQKWEFYVVLIKNIHDLSWNYTSTNPKKITIVQN